MAEQGDAPDLKSVEAKPRAGSNPVSGTNPQRANVEVKIDVRLTDLKVIICGCRITAIMAAFQAADGGPTPLTRSKAQIGPTHYVEIVASVKTVDL